jgi:hypothetical protein
MKNYSINSQENQELQHINLNKKEAKVNQKKKNNKMNQF